jgi:hypothetical protein
MDFTRRPVSGHAATFALAGAMLALGLTPAAASAKGCKDGTRYHGNPKEYTVTKCDGDRVALSERVGPTPTPTGPRQLPQRVVREGRDGVGEVEVFDYLPADDPGWATVVQDADVEPPTEAYGPATDAGPEDDGSESGASSGSSGGGPSGPSKCSDARYTLYTGSGWPNGTYSYYVNVGSFPTALDQQGALNAIYFGHLVWDQSTNDCGLADVTNAGPANYAGTTGLSAASQDYVNTVDFGDPSAMCAPPPTGSLLACTYVHYYTYSGTYVEADIRMKYGNYTWALTQTANRFDLQAVVGHEVGHSLGLDHPSGSDDSRLTMNSTAHFADTSPRHLGRGDLLGLDVRY